jgi:hypothetical protein
VKSEHKKQWLGLNETNFKCWEHEIWNGENHITTINEHADNNQDQANARLMAAAPEMLEALETLANEVYRLSGGALSPKTEPLMVQAMAAIRKAKGA